MAAAKGAVFDLHALDQRAEDYALRESGERRARGEGEIPEFLARAPDPAEFEGDAAQDQAEQHRDRRQIKRRLQDRIGVREGGEQPVAAEHEPGLVAVPEW